MREKTQASERKTRKVIRELNHFDNLLVKNDRDQYLLPNRGRWGFLGGRTETVGAVLLET